MEELPGDREIIISASDSSSTASITLTVSVEIVNNNPPVIILQGDSMAIFVEGSTLPYPIGKSSTKVYLTQCFIPKSLHLLRVCVPTCNI